MLTTADLEALLAYAKAGHKSIDDLSAYEILMAGKAEKNFENGLLKPQVLEALCDLALLAVALKPRPIEDAPKNVWGIGFVAGTENSGQMCMLQYEGHAKLASNGACVFHPTHFIPLSALAALMEGK